MADTTDTKLRLVRWAANLTAEAFQDQVDLVDAGVPRATGQLADSMISTPSPTGGNITFPTEIANYLNTGTGPHVIRAHGRVLAFTWDAGPPELASPKGSNQYFFPQVNHPGSHVHDGWWDTRVNLIVWSVTLQNAISRVPF